jgi:cysteine desulfurase family protein (TIGR01976 family)
VVEYDVAKVRSQFPALESGLAFFDGPGGSQTPEVVGDAVRATLTGPLSNRGDLTIAQDNAERAVTGARAALGDLLDADAGGVVFGRSFTQITFDLSRAMAKEWGPGDEVVVTRLDHDANVRPWVQAAATAGATVRWAGFDRTTGELTVDDVREQLSEHTRLVAVTGASNVLGTRPDLPAIAAAVHDVGALLYVDGVHLTPHAPVDVRALGADLYACSPYKFLGPHHGLVAAAPDMLARLDNDKLLPSSDAAPERLELGTLPYELLAGTTAAIDYLAGLASDAPDRRTRLQESMGAVEEHEERLFTRLLEGLRAIDGVTVHGSPARRTPTALFSVAGQDGRAVHAHLATRGVNAPASNFYALEACRWLGLGDAGAVRAGLAPYTDVDDVDRLLAGVEELAGRRA